MFIHEYQAKKIFLKFGIPVLKGCVAYTANEAERCTDQIGGKSWVVKAQIHSTARGEGSFIEPEAESSGGIRVANTPQEVALKASQMLGKTLVTPFTGEQGREVKKVYVEEQVKVALSYALSIYIDFSVEKVFLCLEDLNKKKKLKYELDLNKKITLIQAMTYVAKLKVSSKYAKKIANIIQEMYDIFKTYLAFRIDINPLVITEDKRLFALDGKIVFDPDAVSKYKEITSMRDIEEESPVQITARLNNFRYTKLNGNIGCIVNGSGLGMATLDLINLYGGKAACILDLGGSPTKETIASSFKTILSEPDIEGVLLNIFGGSSRCDIIAEGLIAASREISIGMPLVVRMDGTNAQIGCRLLFESGLPFTVKQSMDEAVRIINPLHLNEVKESLEWAFSLDIPSVIIARWPCALKKLSSNDKQEFGNTLGKYAVDSERCIGCKKCVVAGCPALRFDKTEKKATIDGNMCAGCGVCSQICPVSAISKLQ
ncbi:4Fe-4S dicluster domain-containing protein [bacterium]|nr:4Fe-4S dicluster domain-containing protein [bacterium]